MDKLKKCPFCGSEYVSVSRYGSWNTFYVKCEDCFALVPDPSVSDCTEREAIKAWNRRWSGDDKIDNN